MKLPPHFHLLSLPLATLSISLPVSTAITTGNDATTIPNANHIFNTLNSALRQWGSSWNHNGMSVFRATVPADVLLYHGRGDNETVKGMQWLAFEPEHAMMFARGRGQMPPEKGRDGRRGRDGDKKRKGRKQAGKQGRWDHEDRDGQRVIDGIDKDGVKPLLPFEHPEHSEHRCHDCHKHEQIDHDGDQDEGDQTGYLHHYRTLHDLNLLYIDGQSAGKTSKGTLDTQMYLLLGNSSGDLEGPFDEMNRAIGLCNRTRTIWGGKIDGFIRMECGFEVLLCKFEGNMELDRSQIVRNGWNRRNVTEEVRKVVEETNFRMYKAVSDRFWGIGEDRAEVDFGQFVTAFSRGELDLFERVAETREMLPRLRNVSDDALESLRHEVTEMVHRSPRRESVDWQRVSDMYVQRYANPLQALLLPDLEMEDFSRQLKLLLRVFASDSSGMGLVEEVVSVDEVVGRCTDQFLPRRWNESLAGRAVQSVSSRLCGTLTNTLFDMTTVDVDWENNELDRYVMARREIEKLVAWLDWPIWRYCSPGCAVNEVCVLPIWPITSNIEDRKRPTCKNATTLASQAGRSLNDSYWYTPGDRTGPPPGGPHKGKPPKGHRVPPFLE